MGTSLENKDFKPKPENLKRPEIKDTPPAVERYKETVSKQQDLSQELKGFYRENWGLENPAQIREVKGSELLSKPREVLQKTFLRGTDGNPITEQDIKAGKEIKVDFLGNPNAERFLGAGNLLPPEVRCLEISDKEGKKRQGIRMADYRVGYYDGTPGRLNYLEVHSGYTMRAVEQQEYQKSSVINGRKDGTWDKTVANYEFNWSKVSDKDRQAMLKDEQESNAAFLDQVLLKEGKERVEFTINKLWDKAVDQQKSANDRDLEKVVGTYLELLEAEKRAVPSRLSEKEREHYSSQAKEFLNNVKEWKKTNPGLLEKIIDLINKNYFSPANFSKEFLENYDQSKIDSNSLIILKTPEGQKFERYIPALLVASQQYEVPVAVMLQLMRKEGSSGDPTKKNPYSSALGLGQMIDSTWQVYKPAEESNRTDPTAQIMAMAHYLRDIYDRQNCQTWNEALVFYHTGEGSLDIARIKAANPAIAALMTEDTPQEYRKAAAQYYGNPLFDRNTAPESIEAKKVRRPLDRLPSAEEVLYIGDSLTVGYTGNMEGIAAQEGRSIASMKDSFDAVLERNPKAKAAVIVAGTNDWHRADFEQHVLTSLQEMINKARSKKLKVLVGTLPDLPTRENEHGPLNPQIAALNEKIKQLPGVEVLDFNGLTQGRLEDNVHPTQEASLDMRRLVVEKLKEQAA